MGICGGVLPGRGEPGGCRREGDERDVEARFLDLTPGQVQAGRQELEHDEARESRSAC